MAYELLSKENEIILNAISESQKKSWAAFRRDFIPALPKNLQNNIDARIALIAEKGYLNAPNSFSGYDQITLTAAGKMYYDLKKQASRSAQKNRIEGLISGIATTVIAEIIVYAIHKYLLH